MELWDTVTNDVTEVSHPPGFETSRFFRPVLATFDDNSVILAAADVFNDGNPTGYLLDETWWYKVCKSYMQVETAASNDCLIEWKIALFHKKKFGRSTSTLNSSIKKWT